MPMDPREFQQRVTEHFENVTEEEFLSNLQKSSPYLFTKEFEESKNGPAKVDIQPKVRKQQQSFQGIATGEV
jgi:hypothetical protein